MAALPIHSPHPCQPCKEAFETYYPKLIMEAMAFGWAVGDIRAAIQTIHDLVKLFRGASGAQDNFTANAAWLESFAHDLQRVHDFISRNPDASCIPGLQEKFLLIDSGYTQFEQYLDKFDIFLPQTISVTAFRKKNWRLVAKVKQSFHWSWKELNRNVDHMKHVVSMPLAEMNLILLLELYSDFQNVYQRINSLPTEADVTEIKTMVADQWSILENLARDADKIQKAIRDNAVMFAVEASLDQLAYKAASRAFDRLGMIQRHLEEHHNSERNRQLALETQKKADCLRDIDVERLTSLIQSDREIFDNLLDVVRVTVQRLDQLEEDRAAIQDLKEGAARTIKDIEDLKVQAQDRQKAYEKLSVQQLVHTGLSIAAATTSVAVLWSSLMQRQWETIARRHTALVSCPDIAFFETKWISITLHSGPEHQQHMMEKTGSESIVSESNSDENVEKLDKEKAPGKESLQPSETPSTRSHSHGQSGQQRIE